MKISILLMCLMTGGCATLTNFQNKVNSSYVGAISTADAGEVTKDMAQFLADQLPPAKTTIELEPIKSPLHDMLLEQLTGKGFGVVAQPEGAIALRYAVTQLDAGVLVRMKFQGKEASRFYDRTNTGSLSFNNSFAIREAAK